MPKQALTIILTGKGDFMSPESVVTAVDSLLSLLKSLDKKLWAVNVERYRWNLSDIRMQSPLTIELEGELKILDAPEADPVGVMWSGIEALDQRLAPPPIFDAPDLQNAKRFVSIYNDSILKAELRAPQRAPFVPTREIARTVDSMATLRRAVPRESYGSLEGYLRRVTIDVRPAHEQSELQLTHRGSGKLVECRVPMDLARKLRTLVGESSRVILHGVVRHDYGGAPERISVDDFEVIPEQLPSFDDLGKLGIRIADGEDAADYVAKLRGGDD